eukprot:2920209-Pleurochrysis_carterae.AAC.2
MSIIRVLSNTKRSSASPGQAPVSASLMQSDAVVSATRAARLSRHIRQANIYRRINTQGARIMKTMCVQY